MGQATRVPKGTYRHHVGEICTGVPRGPEIRQHQFALKMLAPPRGAKQFGAATWREKAYIRGAGAKQTRPRGEVPKVRPRREGP